MASNIYVRLVVLQSIQIIESCLHIKNILRVETFLVLEKFSDHLSAAIRCVAAHCLGIFDAAMEV